MGERGQLSARDLERRLDACMLQDAAQLGVRLRRLRGRGGEAVEKIVRSIEESERRVEQRCLRLPRVEYAEELPVVARREEIAHAIAEHQVVVVAGETGSGKTTQIPKILLEMGRGVRGLIGHTQPRRIAARSVAMRLASELRTELGAAVGYKVRFGDRTSADGYVKIMTDGGPAGRTELIWTMVARTAYSDARMGLANAMAYVSILLSIAFTVYFYRKLAAARAQIGAEW